MKNRSSVKYGLALLACVSGLCGLRAADTPATPATPPPAPAAGDLQKLTPEERRARLQELEKSRANMTQEQREAQRKIWRDRMDKKIEELKKKQKDGTITDQEKRTLEIMEQRLKLWDQQVKNPANPGPKPVSKPTEKPVEKPAEQPVEKK